MSYRDRARLIIRCLVASLLTISIATTAYSADATPDKGNMDLVLKLWKANDDDLLLNNIKASLLNGNQNLLSGLAEKNVENIKKIVDDSFVDIRSAMLRYMALNGRSTQLKHAYSWLQTPMGQKISTQHLFALAMFTDPEAGIPVKPPELSPERVELQKRFEKIVFSNFNTFQTATLEYFMALQNQTRQPEQRLTDVQLDQQTKLASVSVSGVTTQILPHVFNRLFSGLSLEETTVVINFLDSEGGRHYNDVLLDAYIDALKTTRPKTLLQISKLFDDQLSILSPYSKEKLTDAKQRELMALLIKQYGKPTIIRAMIDARAGQITIKTPDNDTKEIYGRPNQDLVTLDTLMTDLVKSGKDIRGFYKILQKQLRGAN
jgi:hypothetical protein